MKKDALEEVVYLIPTVARKYIRNRKMDKISAHFRMFLLKFLKWRKNAKDKSKAAAEKRTARI